MSLSVEDVQSYPRPPRLEPVPQEIVVRLGGQEIARTSQALRVLETHHPPTYYLPFGALQGGFRRGRGPILLRMEGPGALLGRRRPAE